ncbi:MAG: 1-acyl-sn-glycerol-3-phosphate acyltransferase [Proteobacteria bacterium]|nr:1-acyl-sn-glycerol-3-phosphate acyltransferase [Pseudomonadota bacterium]
MTLRTSEPPNLRTPVLTALRSALYDALLCAWTLACSMPAYLLTFLPARAPMVWWARLWIDGIGFLERTMLGLSYVMQGRENLPALPYIVAMQHQSAWETFKLLQWFPDAAIVMKEELLRLPLWGVCVRRYGCIPVARSRKVEDLHRFLAAAHKMADSQRPIVIFPQGTRVSGTGDRGLGTGKSASSVPSPQSLVPKYNKGVAVLQEELKLPVIPVTLDSGKFWGRRAFLKYPGTVTVRIHPPIAPGLSRDELLQKIREIFEDPTNAA